MRLGPACRRQGRRLSQTSHGLTGLDRTMASMPDTEQNADLAIQIRVHWLDALHRSTYQEAAAAAHRAI
jgi:hypothetical protein